MEKRMTWSGVLVKAWSWFFPLLQNIVFPGNLICYEFLSPLTPLKVFSWRSWQIESDRQTGSSVRPQESHSSRAVSRPPITEAELWLPGCQWLQRQLVHPDLSQSYQHPGKERKKPLALNEPKLRGKDEKTRFLSTLVFTPRIKNFYLNRVLSIEGKTPEHLARLWMKL